MEMISIPTNLSYEGLSADTVASLPHPYSQLGPYTRFFLISVIIIVFAILVVHLGILHGGTLSSADYF